MPITTKHTTVYVASDGSEHATLEAAQAAEHTQQLWQMFRDTGECPYDDADKIADAVVRHWDRVKAIMEGELPAGNATTVSPIGARPRNPQTPTRI